MAAHSAPGSVLAADVTGETTLRLVRERKAAAEASGKPANIVHEYQWGCDDPAAFFGARGWGVTR